MASFFDQGTPNSGGTAPQVIPGPLASGSGWTFTPGLGSGVLRIAANSDNAADDVTTADPTGGGTAPDGDILAYVYLHVVAGTSLVSNIPVTVVDSNSSLVEDTASLNQTQNANYPTLGANVNATVQVVAGGTAPTAELSVNTGGLGTVTAGGSYSVPVLLTPVTPGGPGVSSANADILFDPNYINPSSISVSAGNLLTSSWQIGHGVAKGPFNGVPSVDTAGVTLSAVELNSSKSVSNLASDSTGSVWMLHFTVLPGISGTTVLNLVPDTLPVPTNLEDGSSAYSQYTLSPAPTEGLSDQVDGTINVVVSSVPVGMTETSSSPSVVYGTPVTFTATITAQSGSAAPTGSVDFVDITTGTELGAGSLTAGSGLTSTCTFTAGVKAFNVTAGDTISADYLPGPGFGAASATTTETVAARPITVTAAANAKLYDGTTAASALPTVAAGSLVAGDAGAFSETYNNKNVGVGKTLTPAGSVNDGNNGANYQVAFATTIVGGIYPQSITVTAAANSKAYDGTTAASAPPAITAGSLAAGDSAAWSESYDTPAVGTAKTLTPAGSINDGNGGGNYQVTFVNNAGGVITQTMDHFVVTASPATVTAGSAFLLGVTAEDAAGHVVSGYQGTVHFTSSDPLEPHPAGSLSFTPGVGVAATAAFLETTGSWPVTVSDGTYSGTSTPVAVTPASASTLVFVQQPTGTTAGATISPAITVNVDDPYGNLASSYTGNVTLAISSGTLHGANPLAASGGAATFNNLSINQAGGYSLTASAAGVAGTAASNSFTVTAGAPAQLAFKVQPASTGGTHALANITVAVEDAYGNTVTANSSSVTLSLNAAAGGGGGVLKGTATQTASGGAGRLQRPVDRQPLQQQLRRRRHRLHAHRQRREPGHGQVRRLQHHLDRHFLHDDLHRLRGHFQPALPGRHHSGNHRAQPLRCGGLEQLAGQRGADRQQRGHRSRLAGAELDRHPDHLRGHHPGTQHGPADRRRLLAGGHLRHPGPGRLHRGAGQRQQELRDHQRPTAGRRRQRQGRQQLQPDHGGRQLGRRGRGDPLLRPRPEQLDDHQHGQRDQRLDADLLHLGDHHCRQREQRGHGVG